MNLVVPLASSGVTGTGDTGPGYASNISNDLLTLVDAHDHSFGKGVQVTPAGLNISADLSLNANNATQIRGARFASQASALSGVGDVSEVYVKSGDLWFVNAAGVQVQVTAGSALGTGPMGPTGTAGTAFVSNYVQLGVTGTTGTFGDIAPKVNAPITWNTRWLTAGTLSQPTSLGTGSAFITAADAGLYDIRYSVGFTGSTLFANTVVVSATINATGISAGGAIIGGTQIPQSVSVQSSIANVATGLPPLQKSFYVQLGAGSVLAIWVTNLPGGGAVVLNPTGTNLSIARIA